MRNRILSIFILLIVVVFTFDLSAQSTKLGKISSPLLSEISGITPSSIFNNSFWVHNDSGDKSRIYLIDSLANLKSVIKLEGISTVDCEDISTVTIDGVNYILLADIGNNRSDREILNIYMFPEPKDVKTTLIKKDQIRKISFKYADKRRDAEAIFVDQENLELYIISKRDFNSTVFSFSLKDIAHSEILSLSPKLSLPFTFVTAADMSQNGSYIIIKNLTHVFLWHRDKNESVLTALSKPYKEVSYQIEPQGEAICFGFKDDTHFYTISERPLGLDSFLYRYIR